jgi:hypothetical protein
LSASITAWLSLVKLMMDDLGLRPTLALRDPPTTQINVCSLTNDDDHGGQAHRGKMKSQADYKH